MISTPQVEGFDEVYKRNYTRLSQYAFHSGILCVVFSKVLTAG